MKRFIIMTFFTTGLMFSGAFGQESKAGSSAAAQTRMAGIAGGYYTAFGDMSEYLEPGFAGGRLFYQILPAGTGHGFSFEAGGLYLKDSEYEGHVLYVPALALLTFNVMPAGDMIRIQFKGGCGLTHIRTSLKGNDGYEADGSSTDFTLSGGAALMKTFSGRYTVGVEANINYYFEKKSSSTAGLNIFTAYSF